MPAPVLPPPGDPFRPSRSPAEPDDRPRRPATRLAELLYREWDRRGLTSTRKLGELIGVAQGTAWRLLNEASTPTERTLEGCAELLGMSIQDVRRAAGRPPGEPDRFILPREFDQLTKSQRDLLRRMGWELLHAQGKRVTRGSGHR